MKRDNIEIVNLSFSYNKNKERYIFKDFNLEIKRGHSTAIMAPSGAGKTTLLFLIAGLLEAESGSVIYPYKNPKFSMVFQENRLLEYETVSKNLELINPSLTRENIKNLLFMSGFDENPEKFAQNKVRKLSGGEKRRVSILRALVAEYDILLLDEPFSGLDEKSKHQMVKLIKEKTEEKTKILITHNLEDAQLLDCDIVRIDKINTDFT